MRIALVSPYSWSYPGGVTRHIEALAVHLRASGHSARIITPFDPQDALSARLHRGAMPQARQPDENVITIGRTVGFSANGAVSNLAIAPAAVWAVREELARGGYDVVHVHEPIAPVISWDVVGSCRQPLVGTFHCYSTNRLTNGVGNLAGASRRMNRLAVRIAVSEAAAWTGRRFFGGEYRVVPNGVELPGALERASAVAPSGERPLRLVFVGQAVERKGLPVALSAFEALREHVPVTLDIVGVERGELAHLLLDPAGVTAHGKLADAAKEELLRSADLLLAPSLGGESFGMVLTEAFAAGAPVVASNIPGYADVVSDGVDGVLVPPGEAAALATTLLDLAYDVPRRAAMSSAATAAAARFAWPLVTEQVLTAYEDAVAMPLPAGTVKRAQARVGLRAADPAQQATLIGRRIASIEPAHTRARAPLRTVGRRALIVAVALAGVLAAFFAVRQIGPGKIVSSLVTSQPSWVVLGLALMCAAMAARGIAWHAILRAALPDSRVKRSDAMQGTFIGVLMSATLPARLGEPSRSLIVARRIGRPVETLPVVLGTIVSQTLLNLLALAILGTVMFSSADIFNGRHSALIAVAIAPAALVGAIVIVPLLVRRPVRSGSDRGAALFARLHATALRVRAGMRVFREPRLAGVAVGAQLGAWALQCASCYVLLLALGLGNRAGLAAAAGVLFAVNVTAVLPAAPSNIGVFQAACVAVLAGGFHISAADAIAYGIILQAVEISTAVVMGLPALLREGMSWRDVRMRTMRTAPVRLVVPESQQLVQRGAAEA
ncbi:MAG TPA: lysylphosphatidylglycerol synthase domain-containing protein [Solirubrobacteraceae bacterium]|nr:lysylphosphatidylglycerol synthase domain-containing protein [Solirubrobacteraceae bacterium]